MVLHENELQLVAKHLADDPAAIALKLHGKPGIDGQKVAQQILARQKAKQKLPDWYARPDLLFPAPVSVEQASSQATAAYKASLIAGERLVDLTLGMGVDTLYLSRRFAQVTGYELNPELADITRHNLAAFGADNVAVVAGSGTPLTGEVPDYVFIDPSRRDERKQKTVSFEDSSPNLIDLLPDLLREGIKVMTKASPLIDIDLAVSQLHPVTDVHVVGYQKECKEVVFITDPGSTTATPRLHAVLVDDNGGVVHRQDFTKWEEQSSRPYFGEPAGYLYEPHPAFLKAGGFNLLATTYGLNKIGRNSHLYYGNDVRTDFPGRMFKIKAVENASGFSWKKWLGEGKANLTIRNFPANSNDLRKKWRLKEGGHSYLFATTLSSNRKVVIVTEKVSA